ncbi:four helix bundle protein [Cecembia rubra]|uniref:four helix bundle protein n=1 Tax=Cecembia rubra TaxID=1485585 RepID=UPI00271451D0|nr:four helix bundle protein [Cecembia rubra]
MRNIILEKTTVFAAKILNVYFYLREQKHYRLSEQIVGSGTSIGANVVEGQAAESKNDFIHKFSVAAKEARESSFWLNLFDREELLKKLPDFEYLKIEIKEIIKILDSILITAKQNK